MFKSRREKILKIANNFYDSGKAQDDFRQSIMSMPKTITVKKRSNVTLPRIVSIILTTVLHRMIKTTVKKTLSVDQFSVSKESGTRKVIIVLRSFIENIILQNKPTGTAGLKM